MTMFTRKFTEALVDRIVAKVLHCLGCRDSVLEKPEAEMVDGLRRAVRQALLESI